MVCPTCGQSTNPAGVCSVCGTGGDTSLATDVLTLDTTGLPPGATRAPGITHTDSATATGTPPAGVAAGGQEQGAACGRAVVRPALSHHQAARRRRHGRGLPGLGRGTGRRRRAESDPPGRRRRIPRAAAELERRFKHELLLARQVTHKNVVRIHDLGEIDGIKYITMPYVQGDDLATMLTPRRQAAGAARAPDRASASPAVSTPRTRPASSTAT